MNKEDNINRLDAIIEGASKLSTEKQELILAVIEGMAFTKNFTLFRGTGGGRRRRLTPVPHNG